MKRVLLICLFPMIAAGQTSQLTEQLGKTVLHGDPAISPDGSFVAWVQSTAGTTIKRVYVSKTSQNAAPGLVGMANAGTDRSDAEPVFSPDSKMLVFFSNNGQGDQKQLWAANLERLDAKQLTGLTGYAARPRFSRDGELMAFLYVENATGGGPLMAAPSTTGVIDTAIHNQRIMVHNLSTGEERQVSPPDLHVYDFDWSPDGKSIVATAATGPGDNNWWIAQIYIIDVTKGTAKSVYKPSLQVAVPRWSPDGKSIAFIEGLMSDEGFHGGDMFTIAADGSNLTNRTPGRKGSVSSLFWRTADRILFTEYVAGGSAISELTLANKELRTIWKGAEHIHAFGNFPNFAISEDGKTAVAERSDFSTPPEVWSGSLGDWRKLTNDNSAQSPTWGKAENLEWKNDGLNIQGWLVQPARVESGKKYPMVVMIHGGPSSMEKPEWPASFGMSRAAIAVLSTNGYYVLMPNPRGSYGQGESFTRANVKDFGGGDLRDIMTGVDTALAKYPIDSQRLGVMGWSYGGYMTMWTVTQTNRFHAAVAGAGIANWQSYYGQNLIDQWMIPFFGASVYDDPAVYEKSAPIKFIKNVKTPTLVMVGEHDAECPAAQSYEFWHALRTLGVPTQLIVYGGEGHMFIKPENQTDRMDQTLAWFSKYLKESPSR